MFLSLECGRKRASREVRRIVEMRSRRRHDAGDGGPVRRRSGDEEVPRRSGRRRNLTASGGDDARLHVRRHPVRTATATAAYNTTDGCVGGGDGTPVLDPIDDPAAHRCGVRGAHGPRVVLRRRDAGTTSEGGSGGSALVETARSTEGKLEGDGRRRRRRVLVVTVDDAHQTVAVILRRQRLSDAAANSAAAGGRVVLNPVDGGDRRQQRVRRRADHRLRAGVVDEGTRLLL